MIWIVGVWPCPIRLITIFPIVLLTWIVLYLNDTCHSIVIVLLHNTQVKSFTISFTYSNISETDRYYFSAGWIRTLIVSDFAVTIVSATSLTGLDDRDISPSAVGQLAILTVKGQLLLSVAEAVITIARAANVIIFFIVVTFNC